MSFWTQQRLEQFQRQAQRQWRVRLQLLGQRRRTRSLWSNRRSGLGRPWMDWKAWIWTRRLRWPIPSFPSISPRRNPRVRFNPDDGLLVDGRGRDRGRDRRPVSSRKWSWLWQQGRSHNHCNYYRLGTRWWYIETASQFTEPSSVLGVLTSASCWPAVEVSVATRAVHGAQVHVETLLLYTYVLNELHYDVFNFLWRL